MRRKNLTRIIAVILVILMVLSVIIVALNAAASAVTQSEIDALKAQRRLIEQQKAAKQSEINSLKYEQASAMAKKTILDQRIALTQEEIDNILAQIEMYRQLVREKEVEVGEAIEREDAQWELYKLRMRDMEEYGSVSYMSVLFDASSFIDLLAGIDFISDVMKADERTYDDLVHAREETQAAKAQLEQLIVDSEAEKTELEAKEQELAAQVEESLVIIAEMESTLEMYNAQHDALDAESDRMQADINAKVSALEAQRAAASSGGNVVGSGSFMWPTNSSNYVTSRFGMRDHPVYGQYRMHYGIDIRAAYGSNVLASDTGTVITSTYNSSYGNYVVISHGNGYTTLYAHMSKLLVREGQVVAKGEKVGQAGSTGASTATHLHFEISKNGTRVNPLDFFTRYELSPTA